MLTIKETKYEEVIEILDKLDKDTSLDEFTEIKEDPDLVNAINNYFDDDRYTKQAVLGIDIYRYSKYEELKQFMIPIIFEYFYKSTIDYCTKYETYFFQHFAIDDFENSFIPTGDGGFQIFPTPLHAFIFSIYFEANLRSFNSFTMYPKLRKFLGEINLRYTLTFDDLFQFDKNYFGAAIINNSRILSKDSLNRFLIDGNTFDWFLNKFAGIESLIVKYLKDVSELSEFKNYITAEKSSMLIPTKYPQLLIPANTVEDRTIRQITVQKIGLLNVKDASIDVFSVFTQVFLSVANKNQPDKQKPMIISLGNTNSNGI